MKVLIIGNDEQKKEILTKNTKPEAEITFAPNDLQYESVVDYDAIFYLPESPSIINIKKLSGKPCFVNSVIETLRQNKLPDNFHRINAWPGFLNRPVWEVASGNRNEAAGVFNKLGWQIIFAKDEPGLVSARVISLIINEAFFTLEEKVSTIEEIDDAMKLGTNYPHGPFEWLDKARLGNIHRLLLTLSGMDKRYSIAPLLEKKYSDFISTI